MLQGSPYFGWFFYGAVKVMKFSLNEFGEMYVEDALIFKPTCKYNK